MKPTYWLDEYEYRYIFSRVPRLCVDLVLITVEGIVLTKRKQTTWNGFWHVPGGSVLYDETIEEAIKRIGKEELGVEVVMSQLLGYAEYDETRQRGFGKSKSLIFRIELKDRQRFPKFNKEKEEIKVFKKLPKNIVQEQREWLEKISLREGEE